MKTGIGFVVAAIACAAGAQLAVPTVSNVTMTQVANYRKVHITYDLADADAIVTLSIETNGVALADRFVTSLEGDVCKVVEAGSGKSIIWNAGADWPEHSVEDARAKITAWSKGNPPEVVVIDLSAGASAPRYEVYYYTSLEALPFGVTNVTYKAAKMVMKKIRRGAFMMGEGNGAKAVTLTKDFYMGVYQVTQGQWYNIKGTPPSQKFYEVNSSPYRPVIGISYYASRESAGNTGDEAFSWPSSMYNVHPQSLMGVLRARCDGVLLFDLPTEAQWEYACRAGTTTVFNDGIAEANVVGDNEFTNVWMSAIGRYKFNGGYIDDGEGNLSDPPGDTSPAHGTAIVGSYPPNNWGLYDMHGNLYEWALDFGEGSLSGGIDPVGPSTGTNREQRGGHWYYDAKKCRSAQRFHATPANTWHNQGVRVAAMIAADVQL